MSKNPRDTQDKDVIVLNKRTVLATGVAVLIFLAGGLAGYFLARSTFDRGVQPAAADAPLRIDGVETDGDPQRGPDSAAVTIVEFSDFQCPYCKRFRDSTLNALLEKYGDQVRFVYRDYPLSFHDQAQMAAEAAECANEQGKFWEMHDLLFANQEVLSDGVYVDFAEQLGLDIQKFTQCLTDHKYADEVAADQQDGNAYGVTGAPAFFVNGQALVGAQPLAAFTQIIDQELGQD